MRWFTRLGTWWSAADEWLNDHRGANFVLLALLPFLAIVGLAHLTGRNTHAAPINGAVFGLTYATVRFLLRDAWS